MLQLRKKISSFNWQSAPYIPIAVLIAVLYLFGGKIVLYIKRVFKPDNQKNEVDIPVEKLVERLKKGKWINDQGYFVYGNGQVSRYTAGDARSTAEHCAAILGTLKSYSWLDQFWNWSWNREEKLKDLLNPYYPAVMRKFIVEAYRDIYTNKRALMADTRSEMDGLWNSWTDRFTKFFNY